LNYCAFFKINILKNIEIMENENAIRRFTHRAHNKAVRGLADGSLIVNVRGDIVSPLKSAAGKLAIGNLAKPYQKGQSAQSKRAKGRPLRGGQVGSGWPPSLPSYQGIKGAMPGYQGIKGAMPSYQGIRSRFKWADVTPTTISIAGREYSTDITKLNLVGKGLTSLPDTIGYLVNLESLELDENKLTSLPDTIGNLVNLKRLYLTNNELTSLPDTIGNMRLMQLFLNFNKLTSLPDTIGNLVNLEILNIHDNKLRSLPVTIGNLKNLRHFKASKNMLEELPSSISRIFLRTMDLSYNLLKSLPEELRADELDLSYNDLSDESLPDFLLHHKYKLDLSFNNLNTFPIFYPELGASDELVTIDLSNNNLSTLPEVLPRKLEYLYLSDNLLKRSGIPSNLKLRLAELDLNGNNMSEEDILYFKTRFGSNAGSPAKCCPKKAMAQNTKLNTNRNPLKPDYAYAYDYAYDYNHPIWKGKKPEGGFMEKKKLMLEGLW
jgi:Leucine-rich repeat (LRR) protein